MSEDDDFNRDLAAARAAPDPVAAVAALINSAMDEFVKESLAKPAQAYTFTVEHIIPQQCVCYSQTIKRDP